MAHKPPHLVLICAPATDHDLDCCGLAQVASEKCASSCKTVVRQVSFHNSVNMSHCNTARRKGIVVAQVRLRLLDLTRLFTTQTQTAGPDPIN